MPIQHHRLGQLLLDKHAITQKQLDDALVEQQRSTCKLGEALILIGAINESLLKKTLKRQRWLRPYATCFALLSPFSMSYAYEPQDSHWEISQQELSGHWLLNETNEHMSDGDKITHALSAAVDLYQGPPTNGEWRYSLSRTDNKEGYQVKMKLFF